MDRSAGRSGKFSVNFAETLVKFNSICYNKLYILGKCSRFVKISFDAGGFGKIRNTLQYQTGDSGEWMIEG